MNKIRRNGKTRFKKKQYFSSLDRVTLTFNREPQSLKEILSSKFKADSGKKRKNFLIVLNTINSAKKVFTELSSSLKPILNTYFYQRISFQKCGLKGLKNSVIPMIKKEKSLSVPHLLKRGWISMLMWSTVIWHLWILSIRLPDGVTGTVAGIVVKCRLLHWKIRESNIANPFIPRSS